MKILRSISFIALASAIAIVAFNLYSVRDNLQAQINSLAGETNAQLGEIANGLQTIMGSSFTKERAVGAAGTEVPTVVALFSTSLASAISSSATSMTLVSATDKDGNALASSTYPFIIDEGTASEELVIADCTSTACTNMIRGVSVLTGTSSVTALKKSHRRGASVKITDGPQLMILSRILNGIGKIPNVLSYASEPSFSNGLQLVDKTYADNLANQGAATSTESVGGIVLLATAIQTASSTPTTANTPYVLQTQNATDTPQAGCATGYAATAGAGCTVIAKLTGKIQQAWLNLTDAFTWTGLHSFSNTGTTTFSGGIESGAKIAAPYFNATSTAATSTFQGGVRSSCFSTDGTNCIGGFEQIYASTTVGTLATSTFTSIPARSFLKVILDIPARTSCTLAMQFNGDTAVNYGYQAYNNMVSDMSGSAVASAGIGANTETKAFFMEMNIPNIATKNKPFSYTGTGYTASANSGIVLSGQGVWNNTSAQITSIQIGCGSALPTATRITIFGSAN